MKRTIAFMLVILLLAMSGCASAEQNALDTEIRVAALKGPTAMGMVQMMDKAESGELPYAFTIAGTADEVVTGLVKGDIDLAAIPANLASVLYNNTQGAIQVALINTLGVLFVVEAGDTVNSVADLKGKTIYSTGKGTTPEYALNYILGKNGIDPSTDVTIEFKSEATELAAALDSGAATLAVLPQPYAAAVLAKNPALRLALDLHHEWESVSADNGSVMVTGVLVARREFIENNPEAFDAFMGNYIDSISFTNRELDAAGELVAKYGIVASAQIAAQAIPYCSIVSITGEYLHTWLGGYLTVLYEQNPKSIGGAIPDDAFYYDYVSPNVDD